MIKQPLHPFYLPPDGQAQQFELETTTWARIERGGGAYFKGNDVGVGADYSVWVIGNEPRNGGFGLYRWNGRDFVDSGQSGVAVSVAPDGSPWVVRDSGSIARSTPDGWEELPGSATDISVGADGSAWIVGSEEREISDAVAPAGYDLFRWNGEDWEQLPGAGVRIAVGPDGDPWVADLRGFVWRRIGERWFQVQGSAIDIGIGANGSIWACGTGNGLHGGYDVLHWTGRHFEWIEGWSAGGRVAVAPNGMPWKVNNRHGVYRRIVRI